MTLASRPSAIPAPRATSAWRPRTDLQLLADQLDALDRWHAARHASDEPSPAGMSREMRLDLSRRLDVRQREQQALLERSQEQLVQSHRLLTTRPPRVLLVHRNEWLRGKVRAGLAAAGLEVVAEVDNGAAGVGFAVAEQPDLVLVEDSLPMLNGLEVVAEIRRFCPRTLVVAQVAHDGLVADFLDAGVAAAWTRRVPPAEMAQGMTALLAG